VEVSIHDPKGCEEYKKLTPASIAAFSGKFLVRGGETETLEGDWTPERIVVVEFPNVESAKKWWNSPEYATAKNIRLITAKTKMILAEGC
jgi:uncharacterized protein (DUF1330 family)